MGNVTCYAYDLLHRATSRTYPSGSYNKYLVYDSATVNGQTMQNGKTRLVEAYTATCQTCSKSTDVGFSYTARGEVSDVYESTPHSGGYYHLTASYWAHGKLSSLTGLSGLPTLYYGASDGSGLDGEGRITKITAGSGQNPVSSVTYTTSGTTQPIGSLTQVTFGSGDYDNFSYDTNTGRMTEYKFNVGSPLQTVTGDLTWNLNGTLQQLVIADQFNTANNQTCTYSYDDLSRLTSANCGAGWSQTFAYDGDNASAFGNLRKSGSASFQPTYSPTTNRITQLPGPFVPSYDANGNVLNDNSHIYSWDAEGRPVSIDGVGLTYDALGRMVEQNRAGAYTQIVYAPGGAKLALMNSQTFQKAFVPLPGSSTAVYNATGLSYYRHPDWLGSSRFASTPSRGMYFDVAYAPFGEPYAQSGTTDLSFTGQNQDTVGGGLTGLYDFPAREYSTQGRWPSPDPGGLGAVAFSDPQTLNRYAYVRNRPLTMTDPSGMYAFGDWPFAFNFGGFPLGGFLWNPNGIGSGICGGPGFCGGVGNIGSIWGEQPPSGLPPWLTSSGIDWTTLAFGPPDLSKLIINDWADKECAGVWSIFKQWCQGNVANAWKEDDETLKNIAGNYIDRFGLFGSCSAEMTLINNLASWNEGIDDALIGSNFAILASRYPGLDLATTPLRDFLAHEREENNRQIDRLLGGCRP